MKRKKVFNLFSIAGIAAIASAEVMYFYPPLFYGLSQEILKVEISYCMHSEKSKKDTPEKELESKINDCIDNHSHLHLLPSTFKQWELSHKIITELKTRYSHTPSVTQTLKDTKPWYFDQA